MCKLQLSPYCYLLWALLSLSLNNPQKYLDMLLNNSSGSSFKHSTDTANS